MDEVNRRLFDKWLAEQSIPAEWDYNRIVECFEQSYVGAFDTVEQFVTHWFDEWQGVEPEFTYALVWHLDCAEFFNNVLGNDFEQFDGHYFRK